MSLERNNVVGCAMAAAADDLADRRVFAVSPQVWGGTTRGARPAHRFAKPKDRRVVGRAPRSSNSGWSHYRGPEPLGESHDVEGFDCGNEALDDWLHSRALRNQREGSSRTWVVTEQHAGGRVLRRRPQQS